MQTNIKKLFQMNMVFEPPLQEEWFAKDQTNKVDNFAKFHRYLNRRIHNSKAKIEKKDVKTLPVVNAEVRTREKENVLERLQMVMKTLV